MQYTINRWEMIIKLRSWIKDLILNLIKDDIERLISERLAPAPKIEWEILEKPLVIERQRHTEVTWTNHKGRPDSLLVTYGGNKKVCVKAPDLSCPEEIKSHLLNLPQAYI